eukprot:GHUV01034117.1.p1 GENE.GHUV01034117.1~~GHUV01034117.1.p1  ORF type:complete len:144 (+),score=49.69 GHUV01034117.1:665-1096(+)
MATSAFVDPKASTQEYLEQHQIHELLEGLLAELIYNKPPNPKQYIVTQLEKIKVAGTKPLLDQADLQTMFGMFDVTKKGVITEQQAKNALRTVLGSRAAAADPAAGKASESALINEEQFMNYMTKVLVQATPLCKGEDGTIRC